MGLQSATVQSVSIRQNFHVETENSLNELVNFLFNSAYVCDSMCYYFERYDVALSGMADLNRHCRERMLQGTRKLMKYIVARGGRVVFDDISQPQSQEWRNALSSLECLLEAKKTLYQKILKTHQIADKNNDEHLKEYLESEFMEPTLNFIRKVGVMISNLQRAGPTGLGEYQFNKHVKLHLNELFDTNKIIHDVNLYPQYSDVIKRV